MLNLKEKLSRLTKRSCAEAPAVGNMRVLGAIMRRDKEILALRVENDRLKRELDAAERMRDVTGRFAR